LRKLLKKGGIGARLRKKIGAGVLCATEPDLLAFFAAMNIIKLYGGVPQGKFSAKTATVRS